MSDKHLERKEVLNLVYTRQADRMADAYARLMADFSQMTSWGRGLESDLSRARVELMLAKAEVERLTEAWFDKKMQEDRDALLQQVERLTEAGDAFVLLLEDEQYDMESIREVKAWNAAKEGKLP